MIHTFNITQQGESHIKKDLPCQDYSCTKRMTHLDQEIIIAAISDGVGSCEYSQIGSKVAVESFIECLTFNIENKVEEFSEETILTILKHAFHYSLSQINKTSEKDELPFLEYDCTLTGVVYVGNTLYFGHVGDDGIVALYSDGKYEMITERHKGDEANSVFPLREEDTWHFGKRESIASCVLMTDGVLDFCVDSIAMNNRVFFPFLEPALTDTEKEEKEQQSEWENYLAGKSEDFPDFRKIVTDDISFVVIQNVDQLKEMELPIPFDSKKWEEDTLKRKKKLDGLLYADYHEYKEKLNKEKLDNEKSDKEKLDKVESHKQDDVTIDEGKEAVKDMFNAAYRVGKYIKKQLTNAVEKNDTDKG